jgi:hypothetical protein
VGQGCEMGTVGLVSATLHPEMLRVKGVRTRKIEGV